MPSGLHLPDPLNAGHALRQLRLVDDAGLARGLEDGPGGNDVKLFLPLSLMLRTNTCGLYYKSFTILIYDHNDSSQYHNTMITIVSYAPNLTLALAWVINYNCK